MRLTWSNSKTALVIVVLILGAVVVCQMRFPEYSRKGINEELADLCKIYVQLRKKKATKEEWTAFAQEVRERTEPLIADMEEYRTVDQRGRQALYQLAKHKLPKAIASEGSVPPGELRQFLNSSRFASHSRTRDVLARHRQRNKRRKVSQGGTDWVTVGFVGFDVALVGWLGYAFFMPTASKSRRSSVSDKKKETMLQQVNRRIDSEPKAVRYRGMRAKLLIELDRHEEALVDVDWIIENEPHGVDLEPWRRLHKSLSEILGDGSRTLGKPPS